ncbi:hypothetical protein AGLY_010036 [Aphis glycines]|uniref:Uncharacterized protein n=1 Tax=Aphis glycines TaxID=307491 RepID=A0A6G0TGM9_APHGL|nr:hypothetical protein AGLY_010036 [Aphis glycines]
MAHNRKENTCLVVTHAYPIVSNTSRLYIPRSSNFDDIGYRGYIYKDGNIIFEKFDGYGNCFAQFNGIFFEIFRFDSYHNPENVLSPCGKYDNLTVVHISEIIEIVDTVYLQSDIIHNKLKVFIVVIAGGFYTSILYTHSTVYGGDSHFSLQIKTKKTNGNNTKKKASMMMGCGIETSIINNHILIYVSHKKTRINIKQFIINVHN